MKIIDPLCPDGWDELLPTWEGYTFFHTAIWARVLQRTYSFKPIYTALLGEKRVTGLLPLMEVRSRLTGDRGVALPYSDFCPMLVSNDSDGVDLLNFVTGLGRKSKWKYLELRGNLIPESSANPYCFFYRHVLDLQPTAEALLKSVKASVRNHIRGAERCNVEIEISTSFDATETFYRLHCLTRKRHGLPPQPFNFFKNIHELILNEGHGIVVLAKYEGDAVAGAVFFHHGGKAIYKFGASDLRYKHVKPNHLVLWRAIEFYKRKACISLCLGRTDLANKGLRRYKMSWGVTEQRIPYYRYDIRKGGFAVGGSNAFGIHNAVFSRFPIWLLSLIGRLIYRHMA